MKKRLFALLFMLIPLVLVGCNNNQHQTHGDRDIKIYYINDTHGAFKRQNTSTNYNEAGMAYISSYLKEKIYSDPKNSLLISGGDMFQGGFESNATDGEIMIDAMNEIGFDAMVLGNHEFDWGEEKLKNIATKLDCPILSCNTFYRGTENIPEYIKPYTIIDRGDFKIGIIGGAQRNMNTSITGSVSSNFSFPDPVKYVKDYSYTLRTTEKCDLVLAAFHDGGFEDDNSFKFSSLCTLDLRTGTNYVDGIFLAHDHRYKNGNYSGVPYIESGCNGRYVGLMEFDMKYENGKYNIVNYWSENTQAYNKCRNEDKVITSLLTKYDSTINSGDEVLYTFKRDYSRDEFAYVIGQAMLWYVNDKVDEYGGHRVYFANHNPGGVRANVSRGDMTLSKLVTVCPFDNNIYVIKSTASQISFMESDPDHYAVYKDSEIDLSSGYTYGVAISYIIENETYGRYLYDEAQEYPITAKNILIEYLRNKIDTNL